MEVTALFAAVIAALVTAVLFVFLAYTACLVIVHRRYSHIPSPKGASFYMGHMPVIKNAMSKGKLLVHNLALEWYDEVGPVYAFWILHNVFVVAAEEDCVKQLASRSIPKSHMGLDYVFGQRFIMRSVLTIQRYEDWKSRRKTFDPSFAKSHLNSLVPQFNKVAREHLIDNLRNRADGKTVVNMWKEFGNTTLQIISLVAFGTDFSQDPYVQSLAGDRGLSYLLSNTLEGVMKTFRNPIQTCIRIGKNRTYAVTALKVRQIGEYCIRKRLTALENKEEVPQDILTLILRTVQTEKYIEMEELVDEFVTFYLAGQETSANLLSFTTVLLLQNPDVLQRVMEEIEEVLGDKPSVETGDLDKLIYMKQIFEESLRLVPPAPIVTKAAPRGGMVLGGYSIPEGTSLWVPIHVLHHLPTYYDEPSKFNPSRFDPGQKRPSPYVYLPFGIGHRSCIGKVFAMMEVKVLMVHLLRTYHLSLLEGYKLELEDAGVTIPKGGVPCTLVPRK